MRFGEISYSAALDGLGTSGISTAALSFTVPAPFYGSRAGKIVISGDVTLQSFYVDSRAEKNGIVTVSCLDRMAFADAAFPYEALSTAEDNVPIGTVMELLILSMGGLTGWGGLPSHITSYPLSALEDVTCADILTELSRAAVGVWYIAPGDSLQFLPYSRYNGVITLTEYTVPDIGGEYTATGVSCDNGTEVFSRGDVKSRYGALYTSSELCTSEGCTEIWERAQSYTHKDYSVSACILGYIPSVGSQITLEGGGVYRMGALNAQITAAGIFGSVYAAEPSGSEIGTRGRLSREIDSKVQTGKKYGCMRMTAYQGLIFE